MQKLHLIYIIMLALLSPITGWAQEKPLNHATIKPEYATKDDFDTAKARYKDLLVKDTTIYRKINGEIKLPVENKSTPYIIYKDNPADEESMQEYEYLGQFKKLGLYVVQGYFWEATATYIIDRKTGNTETLWNTPILSPNGKYIANLSGMYGFEDIPEGFQIWKISKKGSDKPVTIAIEVIQDKWMPIDFVWKNKNTLLLKAMTFENYINSGDNPDDRYCYYLRYRL